MSIPRPKFQLSAIALGAALICLSSPATAAPERGSARQTFRSFLQAVIDAHENTARLDDAAACLDLSGVDPKLRETKGRELAIDLKEVIDRTRFVVFEEIPDEPEGPPYVFLRDASGEITLRGDEEGVWRFSARTVESIPALLDAAEDRERVEGVTAAPQSATPATWLRSKIPAELRSRAFVLEHWQWFSLLALVFLGIIVDRLLVTLLTPVAKKAFVRMMPGADSEVVRPTVRPWGLLALAIVWWVGLLWLGLPAGVLSILLVAVKFIAAVATVLSLYRFVDILAAYFAERAAGTATKIDDLLIPLIRKTAKTFIVAFGLVFVADNMNVNITSLVAGLGLGGLAFALAAQDLVKNLFGSLTVLLDRPFQVGDWVVIGGLEGTVEEVGFRSSRIRTFYNSLITMPNAILIDTAVDNLGARSYRRWKAMLAVTYDTPPEKLEAFCEGIRELVRRSPHTRKDYFHVYANQYGAASLDILLYVFFVTPDWAKELEARHELFLDILRLAHELGVEFAFPTQTLHVYQEPDKGEPELVGVSAAMDSGRDAARRITEEREGPA